MRAVVRQCFVVSIEIRTLHDLEDIRTAAELFDEVWGVGGSASYLPPGLFRALTHAGNYAAGAFVDGRMEGAIAAFLGFDGRSMFLHSHILGVRSSARGHDLGFRLKQHQRTWALDAGITSVAWTFDPLVRRNAYFNMAKLGADAVEYLENFYGVMDDDINAGDESDRMHVVWSLSSPGAERAAGGEIVVPDRATLSGAPVILRADPSGRAERTDEPGGPVLRCGTPPDIEGLRKADPAAATAWRHELRAALGGAMRSGYGVIGVTRDGDYILRRGR